MMPSTPPRYPPYRIAAAVARAAGISVDDMASDYRYAPIVGARRVYARLCREMSIASYPEIARVLGKTNHSSAITWKRGYRSETHAALRERALGILRNGVSAP